MLCCRGMFEEGGPVFAVPRLKTLLVMEGLHTP